MLLLMSDGCLGVQMKVYITKNSLPVLEEVKKISGHVPFSADLSSLCVFSCSAWPLIL